MDESTQDFMEDPVMVDLEGNDNEFLGSISDFLVEDSLTARKRDECGVCCRPKRVCWCAHLPTERVNCLTNVYILQHPAEQNRRLRTAVMLEKGLQVDKCHIIKGRKYNYHRNPKLAEILTADNSLLLYPSPNACSITDIPVSDKSYNLVLLDGTWHQARTMFNQNAILKGMKQVKLPDTGSVSDFVIRTQPADGCLSTCECAATAIALLENRPDIVEILTEPLRALCKFQIDHGAVVHQSKQWLIDNGLYKYPGQSMNPSKYPV